MAMQDWIHRYPQVARLLQQGPDEELAYDANTGETRPPYPSCPGPPLVALDDEEYRRQVRQLAGELGEQLERVPAAETAEHADRLRADLGMRRAPTTPWPLPQQGDAP